jgi:hypothetical protein
MTTALEGDEGSASRPGHSLPREDPVPIVQEDGWAPGPVLTGVENLAPTGIRSPDRPVRNQSLYRLRYPAHRSLLPHISTCNFVLMLLLSSFLFLLLITIIIIIIAIILL